MIAEPWGVVASAGMSAKSSSGLRLSHVRIGGPIMPLAELVELRILGRTFVIDRNLQRVVAGRTSTP